MKEELLGVQQTKIKQLLRGKNDLTMKLESLEKRIDKYLKATEQDLQIDDIIV